MKIGWGEVIVILVVGLLLFGAKRLPELARSVGRSVRELKRGMNETFDEGDKPQGSRNGQDKPEGSNNDNA